MGFSERLGFVQTFSLLLPHLGHQEGGGQSKEENKGFTLQRVNGVYCKEQI